MKIGVDVDGVLADFNDTFIRLCVAITGRDLFPPRPFEIPCWNYPEHYGYTIGEVSRVWEAITADPIFWFSLRGYRETPTAVSYLAARMLRHHDDVYFITARPGNQAKLQTEKWLAFLLPSHLHPTVLLSSAKGMCVRALELDIYIDDKWENCQDVNATCRRTTVCLMDRPWNRFTGMDLAPTYGIHRVSSVVGICDLVPVPDDIPVPATGGTSGGTSRLNTSCKS